MIDQKEEDWGWTWSATGSCPVCLFVVCQCSTAVASIVLDSLLVGIVFPELITCYTTKNKHKKNHQLEQHELEQLENEENDSMDRRVIQKKNGNVTTKWSTSGQLTTVKTGADWIMYPEDKSDLDVFMSEVRAWASKLPEDTEEVFSEAMVKYSELLLSHPGKEAKYYMQAIKNNQIDRGRKRRVETVPMNYSDEGEMQETKGSYDNYAYEVTDWFSELTRYGQEAIQESFQFIMDNPDKPLPKRIKRRLNKIESRPVLN
ncbi:MULTISPECIES: hypothetical protein [Rhodococcus]|uniref:hypothetical protein n=1 Tax=Rhodococcus TaxID=1827 RepID=UPI00117B965A|nr:MULTISPECIES: hypothetical protein [Rhodococcus]MCC4303982.1 hypothetical protein [Rhodococcus sp. 3-2]